MRARLRRIRQELGLSEAAVASQLKIDPSTYSRYETGHRTPPLGIALRIAETLEFGVGWLFATEVEASRKRGGARGV